MTWSNVRLILAREIRDQLRDRRTMFMIVALPILLYPLLGMAFLQVAQFVRETPTRVWVIGAPDLPDEPPLVEGERFADRFFHDPARGRLLELTLCADMAREEAAAAVQEGRCEAALYFPRDFGSRLKLFRDALRQRAGRASRSPSSPDADLSVPLEVPQPEIIYTTANEKSQLTSARLSEVLRRWTEEVRQSNLAAAGVPQWAMAPIKPAEADLAKETGTTGAAAWSKALPVLMLLWAMTGAFYPAVDLCAGEKERGTLETLLSSPAQRSEIVLGKLVTIMLFSMVTAILNVASILIMGEMVLKSLPGFGPIPVTGALWMAVALLPASALFGAVPGAGRLCAEHQGGAVLPGAAIVCDSAAGRPPGGLGNRTELGQQPDPDYRDGAATAGRAARKCVGGAGVPPHGDAGHAGRMPVGDPLGRRAVQFRNGPVPRGGAMGRRAVAAASLAGPQADPDRRRRGLLRRGHPFRVLLRESGRTEGHRFRRVCAHNAGGSTGGDRHPGAADDHHAHHQPTPDVALKVAGVAGAGGGRALGGGGAPGGTHRQQGGARSSTPCTLTCWIGWRI